MYVITGRRPLLLKQASEYMSKTIAIIGGGNLGISIAEGLTAGGFLSPSQITITCRNTTLLQPYQQQGMTITSDNAAAAAAADVILLAVKPFQIREVIREIAPSLTADKLLISVVTGVSTRNAVRITGG